MDIYQKIWNADQEGSGIKPVLDKNDGNSEQGFVVVNEQPAGNLALKLFTKVVIPDRKMESYTLCRKLFNNYSLSPSLGETVTPEEEQEIHRLLEHVVESNPMTVVRDYLIKQTGEIYSSLRMYQIVKDIWFKSFLQSSGKDLTGFEHVVVGEQKKGKVNGYHFWYKYFLDDSFDLLNSDDIKYLGLKGKNQGENMLVPEVSTIEFKWDAFDYDKEEYRPLYKKIGGFFNGCSVEGLLAMGTLRFLREARAPKEAVINGALYNMKIFRSQNNEHLRTFYPEFVSKTGTEEPATPPAPPTIVIGPPSPPTTQTDSAIKIIAALVNPEGHDPGKETVTLLNLSDAAVDIRGWKLMDKNHNSLVLDEVIEAGHISRIELPKNSVQLGNKGGKIFLIDTQGNQAGEVSYTREMVRKQGWSITF